tara:strand:+ start:2603 stop:2812 length:210 start_codon:yes stop_codon:yes gene_type:complete
MSKALRIATEDLLPQHQFILNNWHPYYAELTGKTPCYYEFMALMTCLQNKGSCKTKYDKLMECLKKEGY